LRANLQGGPFGDSTVIAILKPFFGRWRNGAIARWHRLTKKCQTIRNLCVVDFPCPRDAPANMKSAKRVQNNGFAGSKMQKMQNRKDGASAGRRLA
jgi:hypothetical protein